MVVALVLFVAALPEAGRPPRKTRGRYTDIYAGVY